MADQPKADPPHGMEKYDLGGQFDLGALSKEQQEKLNHHKVCFFNIDRLTSNTNLTSVQFVQPMSNTQVLDTANISGTTSVSYCYGFSLVKFI